MALTNSKPSSSAAAAGCFSQATCSLPANILFVSTQVYGYDDKGLVLQLFDTAGAFTFRGESKNNMAHFEWKVGAPWKRLEVKLQKGKIYSRYDAYEPAMFKDPVSFEGVWLPGKRPPAKS